MNQEANLNPYQEELVALAEEAAQKATDVEPNVIDARSIATDVIDARTITPGDSALSKVAVNARVALVRESASPKAKILEFAKRGREYLQVGAPTDGWCSVLLINGKTGWITEGDVLAVE